MRIGFIGLGKLGLPIAVAINNKGHQVCGFDVNDDIKSYIDDKEIPYNEECMDELFQSSDIRFLSMVDVITDSEIIFVAVQTPHQSMYEGITELPESRVDFDYTYLVDVIKRISEIVDNLQEDRIVSIISTVMPGTIDELIRPILSDHIKLSYNPFFIAMGTVIPNFVNPEYVLLGTEDVDVANTMKDFYKTIHTKLVYETSIKNAELIKVAYNTFIGMKIVFANTMMEICHKIDADVDEVIDVLSLSTDRLISPKYLRGGMGDGGGCHPRDNIAMSWFSRKLGLSNDFFDDLMSAREGQSEWFAEMCSSYGRDIHILGKSFKPGTNIITGSPSILLYNILLRKLRNMIIDRVMISDPIVNPELLDEIKNEVESGDGHMVYFIGTKHECFKGYKFPKGCTVLDPFRYIESDGSFKLVSIGKSSNDI
jgi:UDPglucose 6-dehydrogenase